MGDSHHWHPQYARIKGILQSPLALVTLLSSSASAFKTSLCLCGQTCGVFADTSSKRNQVTCWGHDVSTLIALRDCTKERVRR